MRMPDLFSSLPADQDQRDTALDIAKSVIVQAPAGSGKTDLLTRRFLRLLAVVNEPEEILAITFTRAATAEMRSRILSDLETAAGLRSGRPEDAERIDLARAALDHACRRGWRILEQPHRLIIETIDSLCLRIAHDQPLLARLGGHLQPTEDSGPLYALAARRTLGRLGGDNAALSEAVAHLLRLRDNNLADCERLLADMLAQRDQWQHAFPLAGEIDWDFVRSHLELPFRREVNRVLSRAHELLTSDAFLVRELLDLARYACENQNERVALLAELKTLPAAEALPVDHWLCICNFLLTESDQWRKRVQAPEGFPPGAAGSEKKQRKEAMTFLLGRLAQMPDLLDALRAVRRLPPARYSEEQWTTLQRLFLTLRHAIAELRVLFAERNTVDFTEVSLDALHVLRQSNPDRLLALSGNLRHLLVDEFQDTSRRQHELISTLLSAWEPGDGRTCFLVGDPMQSIYMFRQAEVELFTQVQRRGIGNEEAIACEPVRLLVNFRSHAGLTGPLNEIFGQVFDGEAVPGSAAVPFSPSQASVEATEPAAVHVHPQIIGAPDRAVTEADRQRAREQEAEQVVEIIERHLPAIEDARASGGEYRVAVLVRGRSHLAQLVPLLRHRGIPFRAVDIEKLAERQELRDLLSLARALLHPMDRTAWLSVLRAPWCGLTLEELHTLTGKDDPQWKRTPMPDLIERHLPLLTEEGRRRAGHILDVMRQASWLRWRQSQSPSFTSWIERTWRTLGGPACIDAVSYENTQVFFSLLDAAAPGGADLLSGDFEAELEKLFAQPDPAVSERCGVQLMTIHRAKGLGFDAVIVPGLDRGSGSDAQPLICSLERISPYDEEDEFLVAPIGLRGEDTHPLYRWVRRQRQIRFDEERRRLFYVACTRARRELHLLGTAAVNGSGVKPETADSLLQSAWPALEAEFLSAAQRQPDNLLAFPDPAPVPGVVPLPGIVQLAAAAAPAKPLTLRRLSSRIDLHPRGENVTVLGTHIEAVGEEAAWRRPEGSRLARILGETVHALLQRLGPRLAAGSPDAGLIRRHAASLLRAAALSEDTLQNATETVTYMLLACAADPVCRWTLEPHAGAQSEASWTGMAEGVLRTLRADRIFRAGERPLTQGSEYLWVIDYKTSAPSTSSAAQRESFVRAERALYAPQLLAYGRVLRAIHGGETPLRLGLCYPQIAVLDWWDPDAEG
ncbi:UvrD-helicase domain-containing protein [Paracidobacterium acidisoli]|nr:UvrD-helicase domain-containing protein [Paracidobacterium acidisoli]MBT9329929.1 UvrD-helicase domain-containing protein [Paracidobacterium acidisoli]